MYVVLIVNASLKKYLFIRNISGAAYYTENNVLNEEPIYLTTDSEVTFPFSFQN